ncbi:DUF5780 domain-containing protein [Paenibacillus yanchengensis]|uniref:DUF5780 domain-containing protein n=1 Tax=Paenibacillus yanchengensis TaxID=2035833 RepID=A0ABW4YNH6_9BACL
MNSKKRNVVITTGGIAAVIVIVIAVVMKLGGGPLKQFEQALEKQDFIAAMQVYEEKLKGDSKQEAAAKQVLQQQIKQVKTQFLNSSMSFEEVTSRLEGIQKSGLVASEAKEALEQMGLLHESREAFLAGEQHINKEQWQEALIALQKVIAADRTNYEQAQMWLTETRETYVAKVLADAEQLGQTEQYSEALQHIAEALKVLAEEEKLVAAQQSYTEKWQAQQEQAKLAQIETAKQAQLLSVEEAILVAQNTEFKMLYPDMIELQVKNNSEQSVKNFKVGIVAYDENGYPVTIKGHLSLEDASYVLGGQANNVNLMPGKVYGENKGWAVHEGHNIATVLACVESAEFYDGTVWENEYYDHWLETYKEQPQTNVVNQTKE